MPGHRHTRRHHEEVTGLVDFHVPPLKDLKHDIGNMLNKAIAAIEDENDALASVLKNNIDFNAVKGKSKIPDQKWKDLLDPGDRSRRPRRGSCCRPCWSPQRLLKRSYPTLCDPIRSDGYIVSRPPSAGRASRRLALFETLADYEGFLQPMVDERNAARESKVREELGVVRPLPVRPVPTYREEKV